MICGCWKEWSDQYDSNGGIVNNINAFLERFGTYRNLDNSKQDLVSISRKTAIGRSSGNGTKHSRNSGGNGAGTKTHKIGWTENHCCNCKQWGGPHTRHNTSKICKYNKKGNDPSRAGGNGNGKVRGNAGFLSEKP